MIFIIKLTTIFGLLATTALCDVSPRQYLGVEWAGWGGNIFNDRWASKNNEITSTSIQTMTQKCQLVYPKGVSATPTIAGNVVYYPTWSGLFVALDYTDCSILWQINVTSLVNAYAPLSAAQNAVVASASRTSPSIQGDVLLFGTLANALLVAADLKTGKVLSVIQINPHPFAMVTQSPTVYNGVILVGGSSFEEEAVLVPGYKCCSFIGNFAGLAFDPFSSKFDVLWNFTTIPENMTGWAGAAVWGGQPSIDPLRNQVFIGTGNSYQVPAEYYECENNRTTTTGVDPCLPKDVWQESILAIDVLTGRPNWVRQMTSLDDYTLACGLGVVLPPDPPLCPQGERGPDADFGMAPNFVPGSPGKTPSGQDIIVTGQKNGILWALSAQTGKTLWYTQTSPGGQAGGLSWGIANDDTQAYFTGINYLQKSWIPYGTTQNISNSGFGAASLLNGSLVWETPASYDSSAYSPPSVVGDLVLVARAANGSSTSGGLIALEKGTGKYVLDVDVDSTFHGGIAAQGEYILFGTGYSSGSTNGTGSFNVLSVAGRNVAVPYKG